MGDLDILKYQLKDAGTNLGAIAEELRKRVDAATAAGDQQGAAAAGKLYNECTALAMSAVRMEIAQVDDGAEMMNAIAALRKANGTLQQEQARAADLANSIDGALDAVTLAAKAINAVADLG
ncbi:MAG: hypothetical protein AAF495_24560 [Pseudomonadota bacterium]